MSTRASYFHPFDVTYGEVSRRIRNYIPSLSSVAEANWLKRIIWNFQAEADLWDNKEELGPVINCRGGIPARRFV